MPGRALGLGYQADLAVRDPRGLQRGHDMGGFGVVRIYVGDRAHRRLLLNGRRMPWWWLRTPVPCPGLRRGRLRQRGAISRTRRDSAQPSKGFGSTAS